MAINFTERYSRQVLFRSIGEEGQRRLLSSKIVLIGCGATGSALVSLLARSGVGTIRIIDRDYVEPSNLQRQMLFDEQDADESVPKAQAAARAVSRFNSDVNVEPYVSDLTPENVDDLLAGFSLLLDATDNFETRYLINDYAVKNNIPWIYSAAVGAYAVTMNIVPGKTACLSCIFPQSPAGLVESCDTSGILNPAVNVAASIAALETLKFLTGTLENLRKTLLSFDLWTNERSEILADKPNVDCRTCGKNMFPHLAGEGRPHITLCGRNSVQIHERRRPIDFTELAVRLTPHGKIKHTDFLLKFWPTTPAEHEMTIFPDGRAMIKGTTDTGIARSLYARFVGS
jgi:molybdopterin/thiamine biosynthesis adenylyltransferase